MATEIAGLPVEHEPGGMMTALSAVAVIKGLNKDGKVEHYRLRTEGLTTVETIGMHHSAAVLYERELT